MKKLLFIAVIASLVFSLAGVAFAAETERVVGDDIEIGEGEFKIISMPEIDGDTPVTDSNEKTFDEPKQDAVVGDDIEIGEGEFKIISVDTDELAEEEKPFNWPLVSGVTGGVIIAAGIFFFLIKKVF